MPKSNINVLKATGKNLFNPALTPHYTFISSGLTGLHDIGYVTSPHFSYERGSDIKIPQILINDKR